MKKRLKIILSILLPIICIASVCMTFLLPLTYNKNEETKIENKNPTRWHAQYFATADENSPANAQPVAYKGGFIFLAPNSNYTMRGGTLNGGSNTFGGAVYISSGATFTIENGTITNCSATYGGGIYIESGGTCNIIRGSISALARISSIKSS